MLTILLLMFFLTALSSAQFFILQKNIQQSTFFLSRGMLHSYADSGITLAVHDLSYNVTGNDGRIGTGRWTVANDVGRDGLAGTGDEGEGDGLPTVGEPNAIPVSIGPSELGAGLLVHVEDTGWADVKRIVASSANPDVESIIEVYVRQPDNDIPQPGAVYIEPGGTLTLGGNEFAISGNDVNPDGTAGPEPAVSGISTAPGEPPGRNSGALLTQVSLRQHDQVIGDGGDASVSEAADPIPVDELFTTFQSTTDQEVPPGDYTNVTWGTAAKPMTTYVNGGLDLSGVGKGSGVLLVDGDLVMSGQFTFEGLVIVRGNVVLSGGGSGIHIYGGLIVTTSLTISGTADVRYSSDTMSRVEALLNRQYQIIYWNDLK